MHYREHPAPGYRAALLNMAPGGSTRQSTEVGERLGCTYLDAVACHHLCCDRPILCDKPQMNANHRESTQNVGISQMLFATFCGLTL